MEHPDANLFNRTRDDLARDDPGYLTGLEILLERNKPEPLLTLQDICKRLRKLKEDPDLGAFFERVRNMVKYALRYYSLGDKFDSATRFLAYIDQKYEEEMPLKLAREAVEGAEVPATEDAARSAAQDAARVEVLARRSAAAAEAAAPAPAEADRRSRSRSRSPVLQRPRSPVLQRPRQAGARREVEWPGPRRRGNDQRYDRRVSDRRAELPRPYEHQPEPHGRWESRRDKWGDQRRDERYHRSGKDMGGKGFDMGGNTSDGKGFYGKGFYSKGFDGKDFGGKGSQPWCGKGWGWGPGWDKGW
jgi:hypothetical protein